ncbi:MAG TPA: tetratricopeptide repeat protein, partial [Pyrinomonadaceae bacterium]
MTKGGVAKMAAPCLAALLTAAGGAGARAPQSSSQGRTARRATAGHMGEGVAVLLGRALELLREGKAAEAEPLVRRALAARPDIADAHALLGVILDQRGAAREAESEYRAAVRLNPKATAARANLGVLLARAGRTAEAAATFESVLGDAPGHPQATFNL